jgi:hypothetical protein
MAKMSPSDGQRDELEQLLEDVRRIADGLDGIRDLVVCGVARVSTPPVAPIESPRERALFALRYAYVNGGDSGDGNVTIARSILAQLIELLEAVEVAR